MLLDEQTPAQAVCCKAQAALRCYIDIENLLAVTSVPSQELEAQVEATSVELNASLAEVEKCRAVTAEDVEAKLDIIVSVCNAFGDEYLPLLGLTLSTLKEVRSVLLGNELAQDILRCRGAHDEDRAPLTCRAAAQ